MYTIRCKTGHDTTVADETGLEEVLNDPRCGQCSQEFNELVNDSVHLECLSCGWNEDCSLNDAVAIWWEDCPDCIRRDIWKGELHVKDSRYYMAEAFARHQPELDTSALEKEGRPDYWEVVIHFCNRDNFLSILKAQVISASPTGLFSRMAVCMTDAPMSGWHHFLARYGEFGVMFHKHDLLAAGGGPAVYLSDAVVNAQKAQGGFSPELSPFVNIYRIPKTAPKGVIVKRVDWVHDREWRYPGNLEFSKVSPLGIIVPASFEREVFGDNDWHETIKLLDNFRVIRISSKPTR